MAATAATVANWTQQPHYFRHQGFPIVPIFNDPYTQFKAIFSVMSSLMSTWT